MRRLDQRLDVVLDGGRHLVRIAAASAAMLFAAGQHLELRRVYEVIE